MERKRRKIKLKNKLLIGLIIFALLNMIVISLVVGIYYFSVEVNSDWETCSAMARAAARFIDGDRVLRYLDVVDTDADGAPVYYTDDYYDEVMDYLVATQSEYDLMKYFYVFVPRGERCVYIWDAVSADVYSLRGSESHIDAMERKAIDLACSRTPVEKMLTSQSETWGSVISSFYPIFDSSGEPVALVGADLSIEALTRSFLNYLLLILAAILFVTVIFVVVLFVIIKRILIKPVEKLNSAAKNIIAELNGDQPFDLEIRTGDEIEELADSFRMMDRDLRDYVAQLTTVTADRERIHAEFSIAMQIQANLLPNEFPAFPERNDFDIYAALCPSGQIGGDYYDFFLVDDDHLAMLVGDVAGESIPAALYMVIVETLIKSRALQGFTPAEVLQSVSEQMLSYNMEQFSFVWLAVLELSTGKGIAVNAGHEHPILRRAGKRFELQEYRHSPPVGAIEGIRYRDHGFQLHPGDCLFLFSDGVKDAVNEKGERFGRQRILEALNREPEATPSVLVQTVKQAAERFAGAQELNDDLVMLSLKYYGTGGEIDRI